MKNAIDDFPRRRRLDKRVQSELSIDTAMDEIEKVGADPRLTNAINKLSEARDLVSDYIDEAGVKPDFKGPCPEFPYFGASYPDARCIEGQLFDLDKCDENGNLYDMGDYHPCPFCNTEEFIEINVDNDMQEAEVRAKVSELKAKYQNTDSKNSKLEFQRLLVEKLRSNEKFAYEEASIYTVLLDLVEGNGLCEVLMMLHNVASDLGLRKELEAQFNDAVKWEWS